ncbi:cation-translocating P-type ATPase [candidate division WS5 bacterium]|uniref:Cation-translocating P-type ATPase n=1 Tax=candidate division WS5 bacterium TaxID=2093353 RepID=A0A419DAT6_9BACT|nr:MAG: cation-translocating P-type ATPase [candidate division WS5 bacterium]
MEAYKIPLKDIYGELKASENGLASDGAAKRLVEVGKNEIKKVRKRPILFDFVEQFTNLFALILIFAGFLSLFLGNGRDAIILFLIVFLNAIVGFFQEFKAEKTIEALQKIVPKETTVKRSGRNVRVNVADIVPGDILLLQAGDTVPADLRLTKAYNLKTNDFVLTGESVSQEKFAGDVKSDKNLVVSDIDNCIFTGMQVTDGSAEGIVFATGIETEFGKIAHLTSDVKREQSPLQKEIDTIGKRVTKIVVLVLPIMFGIFYLTNKGTFSIFDAFQFSIGVSSAMVPEGLVATVSIALAIGVQRVAKKKAVIRKLSSVETLGAVSVIVTDKTGTLTKNEMTVKEIYVPDKNIHVSGVGYSDQGEFKPEGRKKFDIQKNGELFKAAVLCGNADISFSQDGSASKIIGDQMEVALLAMGRKAGYKKERLFEEHPRRYEIAFDSGRRMMSVIINQNSNIKNQNENSKYSNVVYTKGSPDDVLKKCTRIYENGRIRKIRESDIEKIKTKNDEFAGSALRVLAAATKDIEEKNKYAQSEVEKDLIFLGLVGIIDPPRTEVAGAIKECRGAGIKTFMVTGDYGVTAEAIGRRIGLSENPVVVTGDDLSKMDDFDLGKLLSFGSEDHDGVIFARTTPEDKMRIVETLKKQGHIVAVTGDGVNDAPALKSAHIGVAMGITGTDVSKEASEMVLLNDSFSSIVSAIREGRVVYANTKKFVYYIFSSNATEFFVVLIGSFFGLMPIAAIQILLIDLCTDVFPSLALAVDPPEKGTMKQKPRDPKGRLLDFNVFKSLFRVGIVGGTLGFIVFIIVMIRGGWSWGAPVDLGSTLFLQATGATYATLVMCQVFNSIEARSEKLGITKIIFGNYRLLGAIGISIFLLLNIIYNPIIQPFAKTSGIELVNWLVILTAGLIFLSSVELKKWRMRKEHEGSILEALRQELFEQPI